MDGIRIDQEEDRKMKKRMKHVKSIMHQEPGECYLCNKLEKRHWTHSYLETHHAFPGNPGRKISEENGFTVKLCARHHRNGEQAAHKDIKSLRLIQRDIQAEYEKTHTREQWMKLIGRNYL